MQDPSPRAFAVGTGLIFMVVGSVLALATCCLASVSGLFISESSVSLTTTNPPDWIASRIMIVTLAGTFLSGLALLAVGVGLYGERPSAGPLAIMTTVGFCAFFVLCAAMSYGSHMGLAVTATVLASGMLLLIPLAAIARKTLLMFPPPPDQSEFRNGTGH